VRLALLVCLAGCADSGRPLPEPQDFGPHGELSLDYDGAEPSDLAGPRPPDFAGVDLAGADLATPGCGLGQIKINEVQTAGGSSASDEFVELYNPCGNPVSLAGASLKYRSATGITDNAMADLTGTVAANGFYLLASSSYAGAAAPDQPKGWKSLSGIAATGGGIGLEDGAGNRIDSVGWGSANNTFVEKSAAAAPAAGHSIGRKPDGNDSNDNSADFQEFTTPTPRAAN